MESYSAINLLLNQPEIFFHFFNLLENDFYEKFHDFLEIHVTDKKNIAKCYYSILKQFYVLNDIDLAEGFDPQKYL